MAFLRRLRPFDYACIIVAALLCWGMWSAWTRTRDGKAVPIFHQETDAKTGKLIWVEEKR